MVSIHGQSKETFWLIEVCAGRADRNYRLRVCSFPKSTSPPSIER